VRSNTAPLFIQISGVSVGVGVIVGVGVNVDEGIGVNVGSGVEETGGESTTEAVMGGSMTTIAVFGEWLEQATDQIRMMAKKIKYEANFQLGFSLNGLLIYLSQPVKNIATRWIARRKVYQEYTTCHVK
jgi:hypothetical protein